MWLGGITQHPDACWMQQVARNATMEDSGHLNGRGYLLHDRDRKFCREFRETLAAGGVQGTPIPARSPNLNAHAERWVRSIKEECLSKLILFGETSLRRVVSEYLKHFIVRETTRARAISCSSLPRLRVSPGCQVRLAVGNGWAGCSSTITGRRHNR